MIDCIDMRDMIAAVRVGAVGISETDDEMAWAEEVVSVLDYVNGELRPRRNRYVHDYWFADDRGVLRGSRSPKLVKSAPFQPRKVQHYDIRPGDIAELKLLRREILTQTDWIWELFTWLDTTPRKPIPKLLELRPPRPLLPGRLEKPNPKGK